LFCVRHNEWRTLKAPPQFRSRPSACDEAPMTVRRLMTTPGVGLVVALVHAANQANGCWAVVRITALNIGKQVTFHS